MSGLEEWEKDQLAAFGTGVFFMIIIVSITLAVAWIYKKAVMYAEMASVFVQNLF